MQFFIDTADVREIKEAAAMGLVDGVTTNPSLVAKTGRKFREVLLEICDVVKGPVSAEVVSTTCDEMMKEARELAALRPNIVVKIPLIAEGRRCRIFSCSRVRAMHLRRARARPALPMSPWIRCAD